MPPYPKRKKYLSISSKELEELRKEYAKDDSLLVWMQRQRKWLWLLYAVLVLLFAAGVIFPKVDFRISDEVIRLDRKNYPELRVVEKHLFGDPGGGRARFSSYKIFLDIEYKKHTSYLIIYRCICSGYGMCGSLSKLTYEEIEWIDIHKIELIHARQRNFCVVKQAKFLNKQNESKIKSGRLIDDKITKVRKYSSNGEPYRENIELNVLNLSLSEEWYRFYFMCFLILFSVGLIRNWFRYGNNDV